MDADAGEVVARDAGNDRVVAGFPACFRYLLQELKSQPFSTLLRREVDTDLNG